MQRVRLVFSQFFEVPKSVVISYDCEFNFSASFVIIVVIRHSTD